MKIQLVDQTSDAKSEDFLAGLYNSRLIAPEKKPFLVDLRKSFGPFLAIADSSQWILDACSQIASLGLGFNASPYFGCTQHQESWTGSWQTETVDDIKSAYSDFLRRHVKQTLARPYNVQFCSSGAESIEIALGACFDAAPQKARKVLAFEGSFHGRMMVALSATWNPKKREPFAWPGYDSVFVPYPAINDDNIHGPEIPAGWIDRWGTASEVGARHDFSIPDQTDSLLNREIATLTAIDQYLKSGEIFAILIEPMQCEGGDRYSSARFHQGLINLADSYGVPLVYDEIQTGLHLGKTFFWHQQFELRDRIGHPISPSIVVSAKKAQVGFVVSRLPLKYRERFCPASLFRGYAVANMMDQFEEEIQQIETSVQQGLKRLMQKHEGLIHQPRGQGLAFAFDFRDKDHLAAFVAARFRHGLLFYSAGTHTARFRLSLAFGEEQLQLLWQQLDQCLVEVSKQSSDPTTPTSTAIDIQPKIDPAKTYELHTKAIHQKIGIDDMDESQIRAFVVDNIPAENIDVVFVHADNYPNYRDRILQMQNEIYEPARQTPAEEFDLLFSGSEIQPCVILVLQNEKIIGMGFGGELAKFQQERGVKSDPHVDNPKVFYMVDLTVDKNFRGGLGRTIKSAITMLALSMGVQAIHGRNRDRMARGMWAINLSLGSFELQHLPDDYPDDETHRDCIYYRSPISWPAAEPTGQNNQAEFLPLSMKEVSAEFITRNMGAMVNKICLSNFVTREFLEDLQTVVTAALPDPLQHVYTASSLSEAVDKITKAIWVKRAPRTRLLTVTDSYFGETSFLTRSISDVGRKYFDTLRLPSVNLSASLVQALESDEWLAFYLDPNTRGLDEDTIKDVFGLCRAAGVPIIVNETGPTFGTEQQFSQTISRNLNLIPDAGVAWLGGQMALAYTTQQYFADSPLLLISTWDGDAYAMARYAEAIRQHKSQHQHQSV